VNKLARTFAAGFDALALAYLASTETSGRLDVNFNEYVLWGSVLAAAVCAVIIFLDRLPEVAWIAIGWVLMGALLTRNSPHLGFVLLAIALMPLVPRPRASLALGLGIAALAAVVSRVVLAVAL
jgi:hypothetical protein